jgi:hypothetical protein
MPRKGPAWKQPGGLIRNGLPKAKKYRGHSRNGPSNLMGERGGDHVR